MNFPKLVIIGMMKNKQRSHIAILHKLRMMTMFQPKKPDYTTKIMMQNNGIRITTSKVFIGMAMTKDLKTVIRKAIMMDTMMVVGIVNIITRT